MKRKDIRTWPEENKFELYDQIGTDANGVRCKEGSCFPDVTVDYGNIHILTDVFSLEKWFHLRRTKGG
ncbi:hypothetical protein ES703_11741 [subsurface metagenome]|nr:hypothetical protein [bacterium]